MSDLAAMYGRLNATVTTPAVERECAHPKRLERVDEWIDPDPDARFEQHTIRTVCLGCDTTIGYIRTKRARTR